ncbi:MAG: hypothetical protein ACC619_05325 [Paracoccaceae bacterium]
MPDPRLVAVITALVFISGTQSGNAAYTIEQLQLIEQMIVSKDCGALWFYLQDNPELMEGDDPLAEELRKFAFGIEGGSIDCIFSPPGLAGAGQAFAATVGPTY